MISTCAKPACKNPFHYLRGGRLYRFDVTPPSAPCIDVSNAVSANTPARTSVFSWLCKGCSSKPSLRFDGHGVVVTPLLRADRELGKAPVIAVGEFYAGDRKRAGDS